MTSFPYTSAKIHPLENGLQVIIDPNQDADVVSCQVWVETGSMHEASFLGSGVSHLLEHMVFKGTEKYTSETLGETVQSAGGQWNAYTTFDRTVYYIDGPSDSTDIFLDVLTEMVFRPSFPEDEFERERDVIRREIDMGLDSPDSQNSQLLFNTVYQRDGRRHPVIGHLELFNALAYEDMRSYHHRRYTPRNTFISIAGNVDVEKTLKLLEQLTPTKSPYFDDQPALAVEPRQLGKRVRRKQFSVPTSHLTLSWQAPEMSHPDAPALDMLATILGAGRSSILYRTLREDKELCLHIGASSWLPPSGPGLFAISAEVPKEGRNLLENSILELLEKKLDQNFDEQLKKACRMMFTSQLRTLTTASGRATDLASNWHEARNLDFTRDYLQQLNSITTADIHRVAKTWLTQSGLSIISLDPKEDNISTPDILVKNTTSLEIITHTLDNGLKVVLGEDRRLPLINFTSSSLAGSPSETKETHGINSLLASLLDKGTPTTDAETLAQLLDSKGARYSSSSGNNTFSTHAECLADDSETIIDIMADCLANTLLPESAIEREKAAHIAAIQDIKEKPLQQAFIQARELLFGNSNYGLHRYGDIEPINNLDRSTLKAHQTQHLCAQNTVLTAFGDFESDHLLDKISNHFSTLPAGQKFQAPPSTITTGKAKDLILEKEQAALTISFPTAGIVDDNTAALELINAYTSDMSGPLFVRIREELGLAYSVGSSLWHGLDTGMLSFYIATAPEHLELAQEELLKEIQKISQQGIPSQAFLATKTSQLASIELGNQANASRAQLSAVDTLLGFAPDRFRTQGPVIKALTEKQITQLAQDTLSQEPTISRVLP